MGQRAHIAGQAHPWFVAKKNPDFNTVTVVRKVVQCVADSNYYTVVAVGHCWNVLLLEVAKSRVEVLSVCNMHYNIITLV